MSQHSKRVADDAGMAKYLNVAADDAWRPSIEDLAHIACTRSTSYARIGKMYSFFDKLLSMLSDDIGRKLQVSIGEWLLPVNPHTFVSCKRGMPLAIKSAHAKVSHVKLLSHLAEEEAVPIEVGTGLSVHVVVNGLVMLVVQWAVM